MSINLTVWEIDRSPIIQDHLNNNVNVNWQVYNARD